ncbi:MAG: Phosphoheptose isomerase [Gammaproteobacteria bacterium]|nr:Phosphoheptose isomerase [Gammaproteobacteria bacterium]
MEPLQRIREYFNVSTQLIHETCEQIAPGIVTAAEMITNCLLKEKKVLSCGNGGSAASAQHFSAIMLNRFELERPGLPALCLASDTATLTAIANDYQYADVFSKQIRSIGQPGDVLVAISTSGDSHNIIHAIDAAHDREMQIIALTGREGGQVTELIEGTDLEIRVPSWSTARIQELHIIIIHSICDLIDQLLLGSGE